HRYTRCGAMHPHGNLWPQLISFENLLCAAKKAEKRKRFRPPVLKFHFDLERQLWKLHEELREHTWQPGPYRTFYIHEPKKRLIGPAPYGDGVAPPPLVKVRNPIYDGSSLHNSSPCRKGKATHAALRRAQHFARRHTSITSLCCKPSAPASRS